MKTTCLLCIIALLISCQDNQYAENEWTLVWEDDFNQSDKQFDTLTWSKIPRKNPEWARHMSDQAVCYDMQDGNLILRGVMNPDRNSDTARFITGGVYTKGKRPFYGGRLEIRAKLEAAQGAWPAFWLLPFEEEKHPWPTGGEIDIMEHLNHDNFVYQTVHSYYTHNLGIKTNPPHGSTNSIKENDYNIYGVDLYPDSIVFFVNRQKTFSYPRIQTDKESQYPFDKPYYLLIDMQLEGSWVGQVDTLDLPVEMHIDWVRHYQKKKTR